MIPAYLAALLLQSGTQVSLPPLFTGPEDPSLSANQFGAIFQRCLVHQLAVLSRETISESSIADAAVEACIPLTGFLTSVSKYDEQLDRLQSVRKEARRTFPERARRAHRMRQQADKPDAGFGK